MPDDPIDITLEVTEVLESLGVPYLIGGSLASTLYGMVRTTLDVDIIADMRPEHIRPFADALQKDFFIDEIMIAEAIQRHGSFNIIHQDSMFKVDVFIPRPRPFHRSQLARARRQIVSAESGKNAIFASPEDTILAKLEWYRMGGEVSERQWRDILGVLKTQAGALDLDYMREWAEELKVGDLLKLTLTNPPGGV